MPRLLLALLCLCALGSCRPEVYVPKPVGYHKVDTPARHEYQLFDEPGFPYSFEYPVYAQIGNDTAMMGLKPDNPYWLNVFIPCLNGVINITYKEINHKQTLVTLVNDAWGLSFFHHEKAEGIYDAQFRRGNVSGVLYTISGNAASRYQFTATDSVNHFLRGALYFDVTPNADSLEPANRFMEQDIHHLLQTLRWKDRAGGAKQLL